MKRLFRRLAVPLAQDDLLVRVVCLWGGLWIGGLGVAMSLWGATTHDLGPHFQVIYWIVTILFSAWGGLLVSRCALSAQSRMARFVDKILPDAVGFEEGAALILAVYLPAVLLTLLLHFFGVRGQRPVHDGNV
jgi:hypothetical protein